MGVSDPGDLAGGSFLGDWFPVWLRGGVEAWGPQGRCGQVPSLGAWVASPAASPGRLP